MTDTLTSTPVADFDAGITLMFNRHMRMKNVEQLADLGIYSDAQMDADSKETASVIGTFAVIFGLDPIEVGQAVIANFEAELGSKPIEELLPLLTDDAACKARYKDITAALADSVRNLAA